MYSAIEKRLKELENDQGTVVFNQVLSALNMAALKDKSVPKPYCAYVVPVSEVPKKSTMDTAGAMQKMEVTFAVVVGIQSRNDPTGTKGNLLLQLLLKDMGKSLLAFVPAPGYSGCLLGAGNLLKMADNGIWWMQRFTTTFYLESVYEH
ncbi:hypothetical protein SG34_010575 [Thalassomonas viridans]|uniref:Uncharacterized protein n=1 Tax=Thalassomonas viridans TaxID=137584 RepID=A0AAF0CBN9_9GAMM|nr:hypothetical protein [Thalassomonas viridans]WDE07290.1 hypothetical protein SG34_010575 [Thalassomonas viridans]